MELFSLLAKLTLDAKDFNRELSSAEDAAESFEGPEDQTLELDESDYTDSLDDATTETESFSSTVGSIFKELKGVLAATGIVAVVTGIVSTLKEGVNLAKEHGDMIDKQSQKMGISAKAYQDWSYALNLSGASIDDLNRGLRTWQQSAGDPEQVAKLSEAFGKLGIDAGEAFQKIESGENLDQLLEQTMYALADYKGGDRGAIAEALFGRGANGLNALLNSTSKEIADMRKEAEDLGLIMTDEEVKNAAAYTDAVTRLEGALQGIKEAFVADLMPILTDAANTVAKIVAFFNPRTKQQSLSDMFADDDKQFAEEMLTIEGTAAAAQSLADKLIAMGDTSKMTADQYEIWKGTAEALISLVPSLGEVIDTETGQINANSVEIAENIKQWEALAKQKALQTLKEEKYQEILQKHKELIDQNVEANQKASDSESERVKSIAKINELLESKGFEQLKDNASLAEVLSAGDRLKASSPYDKGLEIQVQNAIEGWTKANYEAIEAKKQADKLAEELQKGEQEYQSWLTTVDQLYGIESADAQAAENDVRNLNKALDELPGEKHIRLTVGGTTAYKQAKGDWYVPYDNYPSLLHRGEMVLSASQARKYRNGDGEGVNYEAVGEMVAAAVNASMSKVFVLLNGDKVGDLTTKRIKNNINASSYARMRSMGG